MYDYWERDKMCYGKYNEKLNSSSSTAQSRKWHLCIQINTKEQ